MPNTHIKCWKKFNPMIGAGDGKAETAEKQEKENIQCEQKWEPDIHQRKKKNLFSQWLPVSFPWWWVELHVLLCIWEAIARGSCIWGQSGIDSSVSVHWFPLIWMMALHRHHHIRYLSTWPLGGGGVWRGLKWYTSARGSKSLGAVLLDYIASPCIQFTLFALSLHLKI